MSLRPAAQNRGEHEQPRITAAMSGLAVAGALDARVTAVLEAYAPVLDTRDRNARAGV